MSQPHSFSDYTEFLPHQETHTPLPITHLPVNAISEEADPTFEIRTLIEQLQQASRDARVQARAFEKERDQLALDLVRAQQQIEALRLTERELRSHFVEVTALIHERDTALLESDRRGRALSEAIRQQEAAARERHDAQRQRDEAARQRDEAARKFESLHRSSEDGARLVAETQRQLLTIRQARDAAHAQILEITQRLGATEDQLAEVEYQREAAEKSAHLAAAEVSEFRRQLDAVSTDRDATARQVEQLLAELDLERTRSLDLAEEKSAAAAADPELSDALATARAQVASLTQERDASRLRAQEHARDAEEVRAQFHALREAAASSADHALAEAREKVAALELQARESRHDANNLRQQLTAMSEQIATFQAAADAAGSQSASARGELDALDRERDAALTSLHAAQKQIDHIIRERDQVRQLATEQTLELEARLTVLQAQLAASEHGAREAEERQQELKRLHSRHEKQRVETIDLGTQLQAAQREIRELSAALAEARLQAKFASAASRAARDGRTKSDFASLLAEPAEALAPAPEAPLLQPVPFATVCEEPLTEKEARSALGAMRHCFQSFNRTPTDLSLLNELHCHVHGFSERARVSGFAAIHRLGTAFSGLTHGLYEIPELVNPSTLHTIHQTIEFLVALMKERNLAQVPDPATARIYAVDDDLGNCESITLAMEESAIRTNFAQEPVIGLAEIAGGRFDLIFLDVNLPGMDGFELCRQIRALPGHDRTPIVFLTGLSTLENRVQSSLSGGNDFIAKPFNLHELRVKAITLILKTQLHLG